MIAFRFLGGLWEDDVETTCRDTLCVKPQHLRQAEAEIIEEAPKKSNRGGVRKLSDVKVREIRMRLTNGELKRDLAREYEVSPKAIYNLERGRSYRDVI